MKTIWDEPTRNAMLARIDRVEESMRPQWGKMNARAMLAHLASSGKMAVGELPCKSKNLPIRFFPLKQLIIYWLPFPKGAPTAPELMQDSDSPLDTSKHELHRLLAKFVAAGRDADRVEHPAFGKLSGDAWGVLMYRHFDHHLRQFGV